MEEESKPKMSAKVAMPLLALVALISAVVGAITGVVFLIVFAVVGFIAAVVGAFWASKKARRATSGH